MGSTWKHPKRQRNPSRPRRSVLAVRSRPDREQRTRPRHNRHSAVAEGTMKCEYCWAIVNAEGLESHQETPRTALKPRRRSCPRILWSLRIPGAKAVLKPRSRVSCSGGPKRGGLACKDTEAETLTLRTPVMFGKIGAIRTSTRSGVGFKVSGSLLRNLS